METISKEKDYFANYIRKPSEQNPAFLSNLHTRTKAMNTNKLVKDRYVHTTIENTITKIKPHKILISIKAKLNSMLNARHISERLKGQKTNKRVTDKRISLWINRAEGEHLMYVLTFLHLTGGGVRTGASLFERCLHG